MNVGKFFDLMQRTAPSSVLDEALKDTASGRYAEALDKFVWFHNNSLKLEPALTGVRLSFALAYWMNLASQYQPALTALIGVRDSAVMSFKSSGFPVALFNEIVEINRRLREDNATAKLFIDVNEADPSVAGRIYPFAERALIEAGRADLCAGFMRADEQLDRAMRCYTVLRLNEETCEGFVPALAMSEIWLTMTVSQIIAVLTLNFRYEEATRIRNDALKTLSHPHCRIALERAMIGELTDYGDSLWDVNAEGNAG